MNDLNFEHNWRRVFLITRKSSHDTDVPVPYISLNPKKLPSKFASFCEQHWERFGFDYDPFSRFLWPLDDTSSVQVLAESLNTKFPDCASIVTASPSDAHGIISDSDEDDDGSFEQFFGETE